MGKNKFTFCWTEQEQAVGVSKYTQYKQKLQLGYYLIIPTKFFPRQTLWSDGPADSGFFLVKTALAPYLKLRVSPAPLALSSSPFDDLKQGNFEAQKMAIF